MLLAFGQTKTFSMPSFSHIHLEFSSSVFCKFWRIWISFTLSVFHHMAQIFTVLLTYFLSLSIHVIAFCPWPKYSAEKNFSLPIDIYKFLCFAPMGKWTCTCQIVTFVFFISFYPEDATHAHTRAHQFKALEIVINDRFDVFMWHFIGLDYNLCRGKCHCNLYPVSVNVTLRYIHRIALTNHLYI